MSCDDSLRSFFYQYSTVSVLEDIMLLLQIAIPNCYAGWRKLPADREKAQHEKWVCTCSNDKHVTRVGWHLGSSVPLQSNAIATEITEFLPLALVKVTLE